MHGLYKVTSDGFLDYFFHAGQYQAWESEARFVCVLSGTQGGKTTFGSPWFYREIQVRGPGDYLVATPTFPLLHVKALPEFRQFFERTLGLGRYIQSPIRRFEFSREGLARMFGRGQHNPTTVYFGHASDPDSLEAATYKGAWLDEAGQKKFKLASWEAIQRRLSIFQGRVLLTTTPYYLGWLKTMVADRARIDKDYDLIRFESMANPAFPREEWERMQALLPAWKFDLFYRAIFTRPAGLIYGSFDETDKVKRFPIPVDWPRFVGLDFGGVNTCAVFFAQKPETETYYLYRTYHAGEKSAAGQATAIRKGEPPDLVAVGGAPSESQWRREFRQAGLPVRRPSVGEVGVGIDRVYAAHKKHQIKVFDDLGDYLDEKESYSRVLGEDDQPTEEIENKHDFHHMDAERYIWTLLGKPERKKAQSRQG